MDIDDRWSFESRCININDELHVWLKVSNARIKIFLNDLLLAITPREPDFQSLWNLSSRVCTHYFYVHQCSVPGLRKQTFNAPILTLPSQSILKKRPLCWVMDFWGKVPYVSCKVTRSKVFLSIAQFEWRIMKKILWTPRLWVCKRQESILGYILKFDKKQNSVSNGQNKMKRRNETPPSQIR